MREDYMHRLVDAIQSLSRTRTIEEIAAIVRVTARELTGADGATFVLMDNEECHYLDEDAIGPLWKGKRFPASSCISGWCIQHREVAAIEDIYADPRIPHDAYRPTFVKSLVVVPIRSSDPIGAIGNYWAKSHRATPSDIELLQALADSTAIAMESAYLHASMQTQIEQRTREARVALAQAENASAVKSRFLAAASHNLRQPVQTLSTVAAILARLRNDEESHLHLATMNQAIGSMRSMLDTLLDLHRLDAGAIEPTLRDVSLDGVLAHLRSEFAYVANEKSIELDVPASVPPVHTDPHLLQEILRNFVSNAIKYTVGGSVRIEHREERDDVVITVADTGPGIPAAHVTRIFEAFYRAPIDTPQDGQEGLGLGLSIVDQLARILRHRVMVESSAGIGSRFSIAVPRALRNVAASPPAWRESAIAPQAAPGPGTGQILYVEDDPGVRNSITMLLEIEGYEVVSFSNGADAVEAVATRAVAPDVLISDFHLPGGDTGRRVVERVRITAGRRIPALLLTGEIREALSPGDRPEVDRILHKPVDANVLLREVSQLVARAVTL
jgi:two-component system CheB/CheR fusion protein